jgi:hypothetical protein
VRHAITLVFGCVCVSNAMLIDVCARRASSSASARRSRGGAHPRRWASVSKWARAQGGHVGVGARHARFADGVPVGVVCVSCPDVHRVGPVPAVEGVTGVGL